MITVPFDVNDDRLRESFFNDTFMKSVAVLDRQMPPLWGNMSAQHMVEHLTWAFECSTGLIRLPCHTPDNLLERAKRFLYDNRETPRNFRNPELGTDPPPLRFPDFDAASSALAGELGRFIDHFRAEPDAIHVHPIFGPLGAGEWQRSHFKHCYHHLLQFGLVETPGGTPG